MKIHAEIQIHASLERVWDVFSDIRNWDGWNPVCRECRFEAGNHLVEGACISFELRPLILPMRIAPTVDFSEPGKKVVWSGSRLGISASHEFYFDQNAAGVLLTSIEHFKGPMLIFAKMIRVPARLHALTLRLLDAIKTEAESPNVS
ncbi:MAG: SRPBCC family protein [Desulfobacterales bacterium]